MAILPIFWSSKTIIVSILLGFVALRYEVFTPSLPDRLAKIPEHTTVIDNLLYNQADWWGPNEVFVNLLKMNAARVPYFKEKWLENLPKGKEYLKGKGAFLDVGCGGGIATEALAQLGFNMTGVDMSENSLKVARAHAKSKNIKNVKYTNGSVYSLPFPDASFDGVVISDVLEHLHDLQIAVRELHRVLKPGGVLVFDTINRTWLSWLLAWVVGQELTQVLPPHAHDWRLFVTPEEMESLFTLRGMTVGPRGEWRGIEPVLSVGEAIHKWNRQESIQTFKQTEDLSISYLGWAKKK